MNLADLLANAAQAAPDAPALIFGDRTWTFAQLNAAVDRAAAALTGACDPGDRLAIVSDNNPQMLVLTYAAARAGVVTVFGNTRLRAAELADLLGEAEPRLLAGPAALRTQLEAIDATLGSVTDRISLDEPFGDFADWEHWQAANANGLGAPIGAHTAVATGSDPVAWLMHTSGTTGKAKTVLLTHRSLVNGVLNTALGRPLAESDVYLFCFPLFHVAAYNVLHAHLRRVPVVLTPKFDAAEVARLVALHRVTTLSLAPTMVAMLLEYEEQHDRLPRSDRPDLSSISTIAYGAASMPLGLLHRASLRWNCGFAQGYGMTELSGNAVFLTPEDHRVAMSSRPDLLAAAGRPGPLAQVRIVDPEGVDLPADHRGEILVRGPQAAAGYLHQPEATAATFKDGWVRTGDVGRVDEDGYLYVVDRLKDIVITGGENVSSREVEDVLSTHPRVAQVAVIGLPDVMWGEAVTAVVVEVEPTAQEAGHAENVADADTDMSRSTIDLGDALIAWSKERLSGFKAPKRVVVVDALPMNASGKVNKTELRISLQ